MRMRSNHKIPRAFALGIWEKMGILFRGEGEKRGDGRGKIDVLLKKIGM